MQALVKNVCDRKKCTGCEMCSNACPVGAISFKIDDEGFGYPQIDESCTLCNICKNLCPANNTAQTHEPIAMYTGYNLNIEKLKQSSSGGVFIELAESVIEIGGKVCGCVLSDDCRSAYHCIKDDIKGVKLFHGSKYIQSSMHDVYKKIQVVLNNNELLLFSGTPCQVAGLKQYLGKEYDNLLTMDFACFGVGSIKVYSDFLSSIPRSSQIDNVFFRSKISGSLPSKHGTMLIVSDNTELYNEPFVDSDYGRLFSNKLIMRESCYICAYSNMNRVSDITLSDYVAQDISEYEVENGSSLVLISTSRGQEALERIKDNLHLIARDTNDKIFLEQIPPTLNHITGSIKLRHYFMKLYKIKGYDFVNATDFCKENKFRLYVSRVMSKTKRFLSKLYGLAKLHIIVLI